MSPVLSLVTGTLDRPESLKRLVYSIQECTTVEWELIIADASQQTSAFEDSRIHVLVEKPRRSYAIGYSIAFAKAVGKYVLYLNDDAEVTPHYDVNAIRFMEENPEIGLGCLYYSEKGGPFKANAAWNIPYANFGIINRDFGNQIGWFGSADGFVMYGCDNRITFETLLAGKGVAEIPDARVIHHSVQDAHRQANQADRPRANRLIDQKYRPLYRKLQILHRKQSLVRVPA